MAEKSSFRTYLNTDNLDGTVWVGEIVDNKDPDFSGRCKVRVFGLFDGSVDLDNEKSGFSIPDSDLPWVYPANSNIFGGGKSHGAGSISVPKIGSRVKIMFSGGNIYSPEYVSLQDVNSSMIDEIKNSYDNATVLYYDEDEQVKIIYTKANGIEMYHKKSHIVINPNSSITIEHKDSESIIELVGEKINIVSKATVNVTAKQTVNVTTEHCVIDANKIQLGDKAFESLILGDTFKMFFDSHSHSYPGTPPLVPLPPNIFSKISKTK